MSCNFALKRDIVFQSVVMKVIPPLTGVDIRSGTIFRATFEDKGPDQPLRHARNFTGEGKVNDVL